MWQYATMNYLQDLIISPWKNQQVGLEIRSYDQKARPIVPDQVKPVSNQRSHAEFGWRLQVNVVREEWRL